MTGDESTPRDFETIESLDLVQKAQAGSQEAYNLLFERYYERTLRMVRARLGARMRQHVESADVVHEAMVQAIRSFEDFEIRDKAGLVRWFAQIVENRIRGIARFNGRAKRDRDREVAFHPGTDSEEGPGAGEQLADDAPTPGSKVANREEIDQLKDELARLEASHREVIRLRQVEGFAWDVVAERIGSPSPDAARMLYQRALIELKKRVQRRPEP